MSYLCISQLQPSKQSTAFSVPSEAFKLVLSNPNTKVAIVHCVVYISPITEYLVIPVYNSVS